ncbi:MAG: hypothetical protein AB2815_10220 [Candidatus Sedimenticola endophacoides]
MNASLLHVRAACATEEQRFQDLMQAHHYLGALVKIGNTIANRLRFALHGG